MNCNKGFLSIMCGYYSDMVSCSGELGTTSYHLQIRVPIKNSFEQVKKIAL